MNYIALIFITGFVLMWFYLLFKYKKPYTLEDFEIDLEHNYYGPIPDDGLRCGIITPTKSDFDRWLNDNVEKESHYLFSKISEYNDLDNIRFFNVKDGYNYNHVDLEVVRFALMKLEQ